MLFVWVARAQFSFITYVIRKNISQHGQANIFRGTDQMILLPCDSGAEIAVKLDLFGFIQTAGESKTGRDYH